MSNPREMAHAYKFLANYNLKIGNHEEAYIAAQKCIDYPEVVSSYSVEIQYMHVM